MKSKRLTSLTLVFVSFFLSHCKKHSSDSLPVASLPSVITVNINSVTELSAVGVGSLASTGNSEIQSMGLCCDTLQAPDIKKKYEALSTSLGKFTRILNGLLPNKKYFVRAYATNGNGTVYGDEINFTTTSGWTNISIPALGNSTINCIEGRAAKIYLGTSDGVIFSADSGMTWTNIGPPGTFMTKIIINDKIIFACHNSVHAFSLKENDYHWEEHYPKYSIITGNGTDIIYEIYHLPSGTGYFYRAYSLSDCYPEGHWARLAILYNRQIYSTIRYTKYFCHYGHKRFFFH